MLMFIILLQKVGESEPFLKDQLAKTVNIKQQPGCLKG